LSAVEEEAYFAQPPAGRLGDGKLLAFNLDDLRVFEHRPTPDGDESFIEGHVCRSRLSYATTAME
jgi:hypothetical protein